MKYLVSFGLILTLIAPVFAQEEAPKAPAPTVTEAQLQDQLNKAVKAGIDKDAEISKLKQAITQSPENVTRAVQDRAKELKATSKWPIVLACHAAGGKAIITTDAKNQLAYSGCLL